jgi:hypothetical protein
MLPVIGPASFRGQPGSQSPGRGVVARIRHDLLPSGCYSIERDVWFLGDPDSMKQYCELASDGDDGPIADCLPPR